MAKYETVGWLAEHKSGKVYIVRINKKEVGIISPKMLDRWLAGEIKACPIRRVVQDKQVEKYKEEAAEEYAEEELKDKKGAEVTLYVNPKVVASAVEGFEEASKQLSGVVKQLLQAYEYELKKRGGIGG